tara:strand:+ start:890 stop:1306 length:417 start_codon:yes stop_codon:yes gene_type:complete
MLWVKSIHIIFIISWLAGLFYLPRIFVNLALEDDKMSKARLILMSKKLYKFMTILMVPALGFGIWLWVYYGVGQNSIWMHVKLLLTFILIIYHIYCKYLLLNFENGKNLRSHVWFRWFNEIPVIILIIIIFLVVFKPA